MRTLSLLTCLFLYSISNTAQYSTDLIPRISSDNSISERIAYTQISIVYGSPKVRGREIWGEMEEYGQIWRAGANKATRISFSEDVKIDGKSLSEGTYSFFVISEQEDEWTIIFNKIADQWGAFSYDEAEDALRIKVDPLTNRHVEDLTFDIIAKDFEGANVTLEWEKIKLSFFVEVEHHLILEKMVKEKIEMFAENIHWVVYLQAANYLIDDESKLEKAEEWLSMSYEHYDSDGDWSGQYYPKDYIYGDLLWADAKLKALRGDYKEAIEVATKMMNLEGDYTFYGRENESEQIDARLRAWEEELK